MTPQQSKNLINAEYQRLLLKVKNGEINVGCIDGIIKRWAREAARYAGIPEYWKGFMPYQGGENE